jgi:hypothetical protein
VVENPSGEDWREVRMALVSGRPISFQMDLYTPLYVPRPVVVPERTVLIEHTVNHAFRLVGEKPQETPLSVTTPTPRWSAPSSPSPST